MKDEQIIDLFWQRDEQALEQVCEKYNSYCFTVANTIVHCREDAEECVNDTWLSAWNYIPPNRPTVLSAFLGKITRGFAIDCLRRKCAAKRMDTHITELTGELESLNRTVADRMTERLELEELVALINQFLGGLSRKERDIFIQRYWKMESLKYIAERHHISENAVKQTLFRTRKKLLIQLKKEDRGI